MTKIVRSLGLAFLAAFALTSLGGCELYFGDGGNDRPGNGGGGPNLVCQDNSDCAAGCFCVDGTCEEAGFCSTNQDCPAGFHCDDRSSCVPDTCSAEQPCDSGSICQNGTCTPTCVCSTDAEAQANGFGYCDEATSTCMPGSDPAGSCAGDVTCATKPPTCPVGEVPLVRDGCFTGDCRAIAQCDAEPPCANIGNEVDCLADSGANGRCVAVYRGINCTKPDGSACQAGDTGCTCESFKFDVCEAKP